MLIEFGKEEFPENGTVVVKDNSFAIWIHHWPKVDRNKGCFVILIKDSKGNVVSRTELKELKR